MLIYSVSTLMEEMFSDFGILYTNVPTPLPTKKENCIDGISIFT